MLPLMSLLSTGVPTASAAVGDADSCALEQPVP